MGRVNVHGGAAGRLAVVETVATPEELRERLRRRQAASMIRLGARLIDLQLISPEQLDRALSVQRADSTRHLGTVLTDLGYVTEAHLKQVVCEQLGIPVVELHRFPVEPGVLSLMPHKVAREHSMLPLCCIDGQLFVAMSDPLDRQALERARFCAEMAVVPVMADHGEIDRAIRAHYQHAVVVYPPLPFAPFESVEPGVEHASIPYTGGAYVPRAGSGPGKQSSLQLAVVEIVDSPEQLRERLGRQHTTAMLKVGVRLTELGLITRAQLEHALRTQRHDPKRRLGEVLMDFGYISEPHLKQVVCEQLGIAFVSLERFPADPAVLRSLPEKSARDFSMVPLCCIEAQLVVAMSDPLNAEATAQARFCAQMAIMPVMALRHEVERAIRGMYDDRVIPYRSSAGSRASPRSAIAA